MVVRFDCLCFFALLIVFANSVVYSVHLLSLCLFGLLESSLFVVSDDFVFCVLDCLLIDLLCVRSLRVF